MGETETTVDPPARDDGLRRESILVHVLTSDRLDSSPGLHLLGGVETVLLGRDQQASAVRRGAELTLAFDDSRMSTSHATLERAGGRWLLQDVASKNGTLVNGARTERALLKDGDVVEVGHTFLMLREAVAVEPDVARDARVEQLGPTDDALATLSLPLRRQLGRLVRVAGSTVSVILAGESGTGKEVVARALHRLSGRQGAYVAVNCGAIPESLVERELFGSQRGAFSGAEDRPGLVRAAHRGTLFLDELGDLPESSQAALLRVLQEQEVLPVGAVRPVAVDLRVVAATHRDLDALVAEGRFRADLLARLSGFRVVLPPLRERREDLGLILRALLRRVGRSIRLTRGAARALLAHDWPMNVRELEKALAAALALAGAGAVVSEDHLPEAVRSLRAEPGEPPRTDDDDRELRERLVALLREHGGNVTAVARAMGKGRTQIHRWIDRFALDVDAFRLP